MGKISKVRVKSVMYGQNQHSKDKISNVWANQNSKDKISKVKGYMTCKNYGRTWSVGQGLLYIFHSWKEKRTGSSKYQIWVLLFVQTNFTWDLHADTHIGKY